MRRRIGEPEKFGGHTELPDRISSRKVPLNDTTLEILNRRFEIDPDSEYVFCKSDGQPLSVLTNAFWYAVQKAGLTRTETDRSGKEK